MGYHGSAGSEDRKILQLLRGTISRHHIQHYTEEKNSLLHCESYHPMRIHIVSLRARLLLTIGIRRKSQLVHINCAVPRRVFPAVVGNYTTDVSDGSTSGKVFAVHDDSSFSLGLCYHRSTQC